MSPSNEAPILSPLATNTILYCRRWQETVEFYRDRLHLEVTFASDWFVEFRLAGLAHLSIADERRATIKSAGGTGITITLQVADIDQAWRSLHDAGTNPGQIKNHRWGARVFYLFDPEGHRIEVWSPRPE